MKKEWWHIEKNWNGNDKAIFSTHGASNHSKSEREENDYYATPPSSVKDLLDREIFNKRIYEPAVGGGHIADVLTSYGYKVIASDIIDRGYPGTKIKDFLTNDYKGDIDVDIITNPPYKYAKEFVEKSLKIIKDGNKVAMILKLTFLEGQKRRSMFDKNPPKTIYVYSKRMSCVKNGNFSKKDSSAVAYAWFIWEKGFTGEPVIRWI